MNHALKSQLKAGLIALCLALMPTTLCYSQATVPVAGLTAAQALARRWTKAPSDSSGRLCHHAIRLFPSKLRQPLG